MINRHLGLAGRPGELKMTWFDVRANTALPSFQRAYTCTGMRVKHPYIKGQSIRLTICAEKDVGRTQGVGWKTFIQNYLRSGKYLYIYSLYREVELSNSLIYLDFIFDILCEKLQKEVMDAKNSYLSAMSEKLPTGDDRAAIDNDDGADCADGADEIDYY